jgi:hypothetical protein
MHSYVDSTCEHKFLKKGNETWRKSKKYNQKHQENRQKENEKVKKVDRKFEKVDRKKKQEKINVNYQSLSFVYILIGLSYYF